MWMVDQGCEVCDDQDCSQAFVRRDTIGTKGIVWQPGIAGAGAAIHARPSYPWDDFAANLGGLDAGQKG